MKTLVIQVKVGNTSGYAYSDPNAPDLFDQYLVPTVRRYCEKHGYEYDYITEYPEDKDLLWFNKNTKPKNYDYSKGGKNKSATLIRYLQMGRDYDRIISLDNDVWIPEWAEPLPELDGHHACRDYGKTWEGFRSKHPLPDDIFVNAGVQMVNREAGQSLYKYLCKVVDNKIPPISGYHSDQGYMNYWRSKNKHLARYLETKWNFMVGCQPRTSDYSKMNFIHYAGDATRTLLRQDIQKDLIK